MLAFILLASILTYISIGPFIWFLLRVKTLPSFEEFDELNNNEASFIDYLFYLLTDFASTVITWPAFLFNRFRK